MLASCTGPDPGVWERILANLVRDKKNFYLMLDSTIVRAHQQAAAGRKRGAPKTQSWRRSKAWARLQSSHPDGTGNSRAVTRREI